jgi:hypothetical protein
MEKLHGNSTYTVELAEEICRRLAQGESLRAICRSEGMPCSSAVRKWAVDNVNGFNDQYTRARDQGLDEIADEVFDVADDGSNDWIDRETKDGRIERVYDNEHAARSRLRFDARRWYLSKLAPKRYGDRTAVEVTGADGGPIQIDDTARAGRLASILAVAEAREKNSDLG